VGPTLVSVSLLMLVALPAQGGNRQQNDKLRRALHDAVSSAWIYEDIEAGYEAARKTGRPLLVSFR
jgi:hypothetical protein